MVVCRLRLLSTLDISKLPFASIEICGERIIPITEILEGNDTFLALVVLSHSAAIRVKRWQIPVLGELFRAHIMDWVSLLLVESLCIRALLRTDKNE